MSLSARCIPACCVCVWTLVLGGLFAVQLQSLKRHNEAVMLEAARACFNLVVVTREWNARHGGVFLGGGVPPNPYLPEGEQTRTTSDGQTLARVNPAFMTRLISELAARNGFLRLHITSLHPLRPENGPTSWERQALEAFDRGETEAAELTTERGTPEFRYMAPLYVEAACLPCHAKQGYKVGDVRGGIRVTLPAARTLTAQTTEINEITALYLCLWLIGSCAIGFGSSAILRGRRRVEAANQAKTAFLSVLSHELRTPLNGLLGMVELTLATELTEDQRAFLEDAKTAGLHLNAQVTELLELAGLERGCSGLEVALFNPAKTVGGVLDAAAKAATEKGLAFSSRIDPNLPCILLGDGARFARIVEILLQNAVKFCDAGQITVSLAAAIAPPETIHLTAVVTDCGPGIPVERLEHVFEPFTQASSLLTRDKDGLGIGLAIARQHTRSLHGTLDIQSQPGQGSTFTLVAPFKLPPASCHLPE